MANPAVWESARDLVRQGDLPAAVELLEGWLKGRLSGPKKGTIRDWLDELMLHFASARSI